MDVKRVAEVRWLMGRWRERTGWRIGIRRLVDRRESRVAVQVLRRWSRMAVLDRLARQFLQCSMARRYIIVWRKHLSRLHRLERRANRIIMIRNENLLSKMLNSWMILERGALLSRVLCSRLSQAFLNAWVRKFDRVRFVLQGARQVLENKFERRYQASVLRHWYQRFVQYRDRLRPLAIAVDTSRLRKLALSEWRAVADKSLQRQAQADLTRDMLVRERMLGLWLRRFRRVRILKWVKGRKTRTMRKTLEEWMSKMRRQRLDNSLVNTFGLKLDRHRTSYSISIWVSRVVHLRGRELEVQSSYQTGLVRLHLETWRLRYQAINQLKQLSSGFAQIQRIERRDRMLEFWREKAMGSRRRKLALEGFLERDRMKMIRSYWERWMDAYYERGLANQERMVQMTSLRGAQSRSLAIWRDCTNTIPAIHFYRDKLRTRAWTHWVTLGPVRQMRRLAEGADERKLVSEAWRVWWRKCTAVLASRIVSRFTRPVPFGGGGRRWAGGAGMSPKFVGLKPESNGVNLSSSSSSSSSGDSGGSRVTRVIPTIVRYEEADDEEAEEDDRTIIGDVTLPDSEPSQLSEERVVPEEEEEVSTEDTDEGATESEIEIAFGNRARRRPIGGGGTEVEERRSALWDGLRRGNSGIKRN